MKSSRFFTFVASFLAFIGLALQGAGAYQSHIDLDSPQSFTYPLHEAVISRDLEKVKKILMNCSSDQVSIQDSDGNTPLLTALSLYIQEFEPSKGDSTLKKIIVKLLDFGAMNDSSKQEEFKYIRYAAASEDYALVRILAKKSKNYIFLGLSDNDSTLKKKIETLFEDESKLDEGDCVEEIVKPEQEKCWLTPKKIIIGSVIALGVGLALWQLSKTEVAQKACSSALSYFSPAKPVAAVLENGTTTAFQAVEETVEVAQAIAAPAVASVGTQAILWSARILEHCYNAGDLFLG